MAEVVKFSGYISNKKELANLFGESSNDADYIKGAYDKWGK